MKNNEHLNSNQNKTNSMNYIQELCKDESILVKEGQDYVFINFDDIIFVEKESKKAKIHTQEQVHVTKLNLDDFCNKLPKYFFMTHRSYIVNMHKIIRITPFSTTSYCIFFKNIKQTALITKEKLKAVSEFSCP